MESISINRAYTPLREHTGWIAWLYGERVNEQVEVDGVATGSATTNVRNCQELRQKRLA